MTPACYTCKHCNMKGHLAKDCTGPRDQGGGGGAFVTFLGASRLLSVTVAGGFLTRVFLAASFRSSLSRNAVSFISAMRSLSAEISSAVRLYLGF